MKRFIQFLAVLVAFWIPTGVMAQSNSVYADASFTHNGTFPKSVKDLTGGNIGGIDAGASTKLAGPLGLAFDLGFSHNGVQNQFLFMGGPEGSLRFKQSRFFAHALVGGAYEVEKLQGFSAKALAGSSFAYALGGGGEKY